LTFIALGRSHLTHIAIRDRVFQEALFQLNSQIPLRGISSKRWMFVDKTRLKTKRKRFLFPILFFTQIQSSPTITQ